jgi:hypothetical protein
MPILQSLTTELSQNTTDKRQNYKYDFGTMTITKCDKCKKVIKNDQDLSIRVGFNYLVLCKKCSAEMVAFLVKENLLQDALKRAGLIKG